MPGAHEQGAEVRSGVGERFLSSLFLNTPRPPVRPLFVGRNASSRCVSPGTLLFVCLIAHGRPLSGLVVDREHPSSPVRASCSRPTLPAVAPRDFWAVLQEMGADFAMGSDFCVVSRGRCAALIPLTWGNVGILKPFWLNSPAKPPRSHERVRRSSR